MPDRTIIDSIQRHSLPNINASGIQDNIDRVKSDRIPVTVKLYFHAPELLGVDNGPQAVQICPPPLLESQFVNPLLKDVLHFGENLAEGLGIPHIVIDTRNVVIPVITVLRQHRRIDQAGIRTPRGILAGPLVNQQHSRINTGKIFLGNDLAFPSAVQEGKHGGCQQQYMKGLLHRAQ